MTLSMIVVIIGGTAFAVSAFCIRWLLYFPESEGVGDIIRIAFVSLAIMAACLFWLTYVSKQDVPELYVDETLKTADLAEILAGDWRTRHGVELRLNFAGPLRSMSVEFVGEGQTHQLGNLHMQCDSELVCTGRVKGRVAVAIEVVARDLIYLRCLPHQPVSNEAYEQGECKRERGFVLVSIPFDREV